MRQAVAVVTDRVADGQGKRAPRHMRPGALVDGANTQDVGEGRVGGPRKRALVSMPPKPANVRRRKTSLGGAAAAGGPVQAQAVPAPQPGEPHEFAMIVSPISPDGWGDRCTVCGQTIWSGAVERHFQSQRHVVLQVQVPVVRGVMNCMTRITNLRTATGSTRITELDSETAAQACAGGNGAEDCRGGCACGVGDPLRRTCSPEWLLRAVLPPVSAVL